MKDLKRRMGEKPFIEQFEKTGDPLQIMLVRIKL